MPLFGNTLFAGDSITVGLAPFVGVSGQKKTVAEVGRPVAWLLQTLRSLVPLGGLQGYQNLVVLIGTNDIGGGRTPQAITQDTLAIWALAKSQGLRVFAMTIPPVKGYAGFPPGIFPTVNARRQAINAALGQAFQAQGAADGLIDLSTLLADPQDPDKLSPSFDSGDHLHPKKDALGALLTKALSVAPSVSPSVSPGPTPFGAPGEPLLQGASTSAMGMVMLVGAFGIAAYMLTRKRLSW